MKDKMINVLIFIGAILTAPIWVVFLIIILFSMPNDFYKKYDEHLDDI